MTIFYVLFLVFATFGWGWIFYKKDYHPQPFLIILKSFAGGLFSMVPLFFYRYVYENFFPQIASYAIFRPLFDSFLLNGIIFFLLNILILFVILTFFTGFLVFVLMFFRREVLVNIRRSLRSEEIEFVTVSLMIGILVYLEKLVEGFLGAPIITVLLGGVLFLTVIEEFVKHLVVRFIDDKRLSDVGDAITLSIVVGLAFAFVETILYAVVVNDLALILPRSLMSMPIHVISSGIFGYYYGLSHFAKPISIANRQEGTYLINLRWFDRIFRVRRSSVFGEKMMIRGLALATLFHALANLLFELNLTFFVVPLIAGGLFLLDRFYKESYKIHRVLITST